MTMTWAPAPDPLVTPPPPSLPWSWGADDVERTAGYPCDTELGVPGRALVRAVTSAAPAAVAFRWLCQLTVAPYSYDLVDNLGRRSPRRLTPGADDLAVGRSFCTIARITSYAPGEHITARTTPRGERLFGALVMTYAVRPSGTGSRLIGRFALPAPRSVRGRVAQEALAWGDLVMMGRQLRTLAALAARDGSG